MRVIILKAIGFYQIFISPLLGQNCRFYPSCSEYCRQIAQKHGILKGFFLSTKRILKCGPWHPGGVDLPPKG